jgi:hypothetical protein
MENMSSDWKEAFDRLISLGYSIGILGDDLSLKWQGQGDPPKDEVLPLIQIIKQNKDEIFRELEKPLSVHSKIDTALEEINRNYQPGTLEWTKVNRPEDWKKMISLEDRINQAILRGDGEELERALGDYQKLIFEMAKLFKTPQGETLDLFGKSLTLSKGITIDQGESSCPE